MITSVQVDSNCGKSPCFNFCVPYLRNVIVLLPVLMMVYTYGVFAEMNIFFHLT